MERLMGGNYYMRMWGVVPRGREAHARRSLFGQARGAPRIGRVSNAMRGRSSLSLCAPRCLRVRGRAGSLSLLPVA